MTEKSPQIKLILHSNIGSTCEAFSACFFFTSSVRLLGKFGLFFSLNCRFLERILCIENCRRQNFIPRI